MALEILSYSSLPIEAAQTNINFVKLKHLQKQTSKHTQRHTCTCKHTQFVSDLQKYFKEEKKTKKKTLNCWLKWFAKRWRKQTRFAHKVFLRESECGRESEERKE